MEFRNENVRARMESDRISSLPNEIIHHIMSYSDTKYAVQTSVLSSRWRLIWTSLPYLSFGSDTFRNRSKFSEFVNWVLSHRDNLFEVLSLDLNYKGSINWKIMQTIGDYVVSHNVPKVNISVYKLKGKKDQKFPLWLFSSQSLKHLSIKTNRQMFGIFPLPQSPWDSPALTTIELSNVWLCANITMRLDLFSKCVNLLNLTLRDCKLIGLKLLKIRCPRLVRLSISMCWPSKYEILAPNLNYFYYKGDEPLLLSTGGLNSLERVNLHMSITTISNVQTQLKAHEFMNMLGKLRSAKFVILNRPVIEFLSKVLDLLEHQPSPFYNLKCLRIEGLERPKKCAKSDMTDQVINFLLNSSQTATVSKEYQKYHLSKKREYQKYQEKKMYANGLDLVPIKKEAASGSLAWILFLSKKKRQVAWILFLSKKKRAWILFLSKKKQQVAWIMILSKKRRQVAWVMQLVHAA